MSNKKLLMQLNSVDIKMTQSEQSRRRKDDQ